MSPPSGICWTTTRFPSTSAFVVISHSCYDEQTVCSYLVHLEQTRIYFSPVLDAHCDRMKLRRMFMKRAVFEFMDPHNLHEVQIGGREWRV